LPKDSYLLYLEVKAEGGIALTMFGGSTLVAQDSPQIFVNLYAGNDEIIPYFQKMVDEVHQARCSVDFQKIAKHYLQSRRQF